MSKVEQAVRNAEQLAADNSHGYGWGGWGPDYDCGHLIIHAFEEAGIPVRSKGGASFTGNMRRAWLLCGAQDVKAQVNLNTGAGLKRGDALVNEANHAALFVGGGRIVQARTDLDGKPGDSSGQEIRVQGYYNFTPGGWDCVLRFPEEPAEDKDVPTTEPQPEPQQKTPEVQVLPIGVTISAPEPDEKVHAYLYTVSLNLLKQGDRGAQVRTLQLLLAGRGYDCGADQPGVFGAGTRKALLAFQRAAKISVDGECGGESYTALLRNPY